MVINGLAVIGSSRLMCTLDTHKTTTITQKLGNTMAQTSQETPTCNSFKMPKLAINGAPF